MGELPVFSLTVWQIFIQANTKAKSLYGREGVASWVLCCTKADFERIEQTAIGTKLWPHPW